MREMIKLGTGVTLFLLLFSFLFGHVSLAQTLPTSRADIQRSFSGLVDKTAPSVVNIYTKLKSRVGNHRTLFDDPFFRKFLGDVFTERFSYKQNSLGSGVLVSPDGVIVTNQHVIKDAEEIRIVLSDRREFDAKLIVTDDQTDLSFLKVESKEKLPFLNLANSDDLKVGDLVLAIGNPFGVGQTVTNGIISALSRTGVGLSKLNAFIQTDAAINPGNSGGALVTLDGKLAGINTAIFSNSGGSHGIGFAIPSNMVRAVIRGVLKFGRLVRGWLGVSGQSIDQELALSFGLQRPVGVLINLVHMDSVAREAQIRIGDIILSINDKEIYNQNELAHRIATLAIGEEVKVKLLRNKVELVKKFPLRGPPSSPKKNLTDLGGKNPLAGARIANLSPAFAEKINFNPFISGVIITNIKRGSFAHRFGFKVNDIIKKIGPINIERVNDIKKIIESADRNWNIGIMRDEKNLTLIIK